MRRYKVIISSLILSIFWGELIYAESPGLFNSILEEGRIRGIRASLLPDGRSIYLLWEPSGTEGEVIVARSNSVIDTPEKLYIADSMGRFPSQSRNTVSNYYDYNLKPGTYYYAVVPVRDVRERKVRLIAGENYTIEPVQVQRAQELPETQKLEPDPSQASSKSVGAITARAEGNNIRINWVPPWNAIPGKTIYSVYRSSSPLSTMEEMREADKLAEIPHPINTYLDQNIEKSQTLYYGVSVKDESKEEQLPLEKGKSFVRVFFIRTKEGKTEAIRDSQPTEITEQEQKEGDTPANLIVQGFGYSREGKGAILKWNHPPNADDTTQYTIYASVFPFNRGVNSFVGGGVIKVGTLSYPKSSLLIREIKPVENLYFAITAKKAGIPENLTAEDGVNTFRYEFEKDISPDEKKEVVVPQSDPEIKNPPETETNPSRTPVLGSKPVSQSISDPGEKLEAELEDNFSEEKVIRDTLDFHDSSRLYQILRESYAKKDYHKCIFLLNSFIRSESDPKLLGMARLYRGISHYKTGGYSKALEDFLHKETMNYNSERTVFWKNKTLAKLGRGGG